MEKDKYSKKQQMESEEKPDTANIEFSQIISKKKKEITDLSVKVPLYGNLNLSILSEKGFSKIETLRFTEGYLTSVTNIPSNIRKLILSEQLISKLELPDDLEHLEIENNLFVGDFSLKAQRSLKYVNVSFNNIKSFGNNGENLPESLEELYCHHNLLQNLYLETCPKLRVLHCDYNPKLKVYDIPDSVTDIRLPEKAIQLELNKSEQNADKNNSEEREKEINNLENAYDESIREYFRIKQKYETELHSLKKSKKKKLPKCYGCKKNVGMVFSGKNQKYTAYCGNTTKPCNWKLVLHRGDNHIFRDTMEEMRKILEETKENIIRQKMDTLFNYISEEKSVDLFKKQLSLFKINSEMVDKYKKRYENLYFNSVKQEIIQQKKKKIQDKIIEIQENIEKGEIDEVVKLQLEIKGISEYIQRETYEFMEIWFNQKKEEFILDQNNTIYSKLEINHGEPLQVE